MADSRENVGWFSLVFGMLWLSSIMMPVSCIGVNWGSQCSHPLSPNIVVRMLRENGFQKVKLFDADYDTLRALGKTGIEVMVGIPNDMLLTLANSPKAAEKWVSQNISEHLSSNGVNIRLPLSLILFCLYSYLSFPNMFFLMLVMSTCMRIQL